MTNLEFIAFKSVNSQNLLAFVPSFHADPINVLGLLCRIQFVPHQVLTTCFGYLISRKGYYRWRSKINGLAIVYDRKGLPLSLKLLHFLFDVLICRSFFLISLVVFLRQALADANNEDRQNDEQGRKETNENLRWQKESSPNLFLACASARNCALYHACAL
jgi:hypothetical protein